MDTLATEGCFCHTNHDLADVFGRMDFLVDNLHVLVVMLAKFVHG